MKKRLMMLVSALMLVGGVLPAQACKPPSPPPDPTPIQLSKGDLKSRVDSSVSETIQKKIGLSDTIFTAEYTGERTGGGMCSELMTFKHAEAVKSDIASSTVDLVISISTPPVPDPGISALPDTYKLKTGARYLIFAHKNDWSPNFASKHPLYYPYFIIPLEDTNKN